MISLVKWVEAKCLISFLMLLLRCITCTFESRDNDCLGQRNVSRNFRGKMVVDCKSRIYPSMNYHSQNNFLKGVNT